MAKSSSFPKPAFHSTSGNVMLMAKMSAAVPLPCSCTQPAESTPCSHSYPLLLIVILSIPIVPPCSTWVFSSLNDLESPTGLPHLPPPDRLYGPLQIPVGIRHLPLCFFSTLLLKILGRLPLASRKRRIPSRWTEGPMGIPPLLLC